MNYRTYHSLLFEHFLDCSKTNLKMNAINSIILCWSFLTITEIGATKMMVKRGGQEPLRPFLTNQSMDDFRNKKLLLARRVTLEQKVRNPKLRNVLAIVLQKKKQRLATCTRNFNCFKTAKNTNRLNRFKNYHHWFFYCWSKIKKKYAQYLVFFDLSSTHATYRYSTYQYLTFLDRYWPLNFDKSPGERTFSRTKLKKLKENPSLAFFEGTYGPKYDMVFSKVLFEFYVFEIIISIFELKLIIIRSTIFYKLIKNSRPRVVPFVRPCFQLNGSLFVLWFI